MSEQSWIVGDLALIASDRKEARMLVVIAGILRDRAPVTYTARYLDPTVSLEECCATADRLHTPASCGVTVPPNALSLADRARVRPSRHHEAALPKWAQEELAWRWSEMQRLADAFQRQSQAHAVLEQRTWFTIGGPVHEEERGRRHLWFLSHDRPHPACDLGPGDVLLVGRKTREGEL